MLKQILPLSLSLSLWLCAILVQLGVCTEIAARRVDRYPIFKAYILWQTGTSLCAFCAALLNQQYLYVAAFFVGTIAADLLLLCVGFEIYRFVFGPSLALPQFVPARAGAMTILSFTASLAVGVLVYSLARHRWLYGLVVVEQVLTVAAWSSFLILLIYSRSLKLPWPRRVAQIWIGFAVYLTINVAAVFVRSTGAQTLAQTAGVVGQFAYLLSVGWWFCCFWKNEPAPVQATDEQIREMLCWHHETMAFLRRAGSTRK